MKTVHVLLEALRIVACGLLLAFFTPPAIARLSLPVLAVGAVSAGALRLRSPAAFQAWFAWLAPKAAEILRGVTHATVIVAAVAMALRFGAPATLHTILTHLNESPGLTPVGEFALLAGALNFFFGSYPARSVRQTVASPAAARLA